MRPLRLVIDTNVLLSALLFSKGSMAWVRTAWQSNVIRPLVSRDTTEELIRVLAYPKFKLSTQEKEHLLGDYLPWCETVNVKYIISTPECRDPLDAPFLALALSADADALVTGENDLLVLSPCFRIPILTPAALKQRIDELSLGSAL